MQYKFCNKCGAKLAKDADFCTECGAKQDIVNSDKNTLEENRNKQDFEGNSSQDKAGNGEMWHPYNQYEKDQFNKSTLLATRDAFKLNRCIGRSNFWYAYLYIFIILMIVTFVATALMIPVSIVADLLTLSLVIRRANDGIADSALRMTMIVVFAITIIGDIVPATMIVMAVAQFGVILFVGLQKTDWSTKYERPIG